MRTMIDHLQHMIESDLYRGIFSLQALLLLRNQTNLESISSRIIQTRSPRLLHLLIRNASVNFSRLSDLCMTQHDYAYMVAKYGTDREFAFFLESYTDADFDILLRVTVSGQNVDRTRLLVQKTEYLEYRIDSATLYCPSKIRQEICVILIVGSVIKIGSPSRLLFDVVLTGNEAMVRFLIESAKNLRCPLIKLDCEEAIERAIYMFHDDPAARNDAADRLHYYEDELPDFWSNP